MRAKALVRAYRNLARFDHSASALINRCPEKWVDVFLVSPIPLRFKLLREVIHLISQNPVLREIVPLEGVGSKRYRQERHVGFFWSLAVL